MEDILASIRRILSEDESANGASAPAPAGSRPAPPLSVYPAQPATPPPAPPPPEQVLTLDATMMVRQPPAPPPPTPPAPIFAMHPVPEVAAMSQSASQHSPLVAPEAAAAASASIGQLMRTLSEAQAHNTPHSPVEGMTPIYRGGPTLEDMVRDEMRVLLKSWLDVHLPVMVESLVRAEIARVISRSVG
jgi:cell pole-organizing protein PopZ